MGLLDKFLKPSKEKQKSFGYDSQLGYEVCNPKHTFITTDYGNPFVYKAWENNILIQDGFISNPIVYPVINKLHEVASDVPFKVMEKIGNEWEEVEGGALKEFIDKQFSKDFRYNTGVFLSTTGEYFWRTTNGAFNLVTELELLESNLIDVKTNIYNEVTGYEYDQLNTMQTIYGIDEVLHGKYFNPSLIGIEEHRGLSPLQPVYNSIKSSNNRQLASASMLANRGATGVLTSGSDLPMTNDEREGLQKAGDKILGGADKFNKIISTTANVRYFQMGMSSTDLQMIEGADLDLRTICNALSVPSNMFNDKSASTESNVKTDLKKFYTDAVIPLNNKLISHINETIVPAYRQFENKDLKVKQCTDNIDALQEDKAIEAEKNAKNIATMANILNMPLDDNTKKELINKLGFDIDINIQGNEENTIQE